MERRIVIKWTILAKARPDIAEQRFFYHWRVIHAPLALQMRRMRRYVQNRKIDANVWGLPDGGVQGVVECWFDDLAAASETLNGPDYLDHAQPDEVNLGDPSGSSVMMMHESVIAPVEAARHRDPVKAMIFLSRRHHVPWQIFRSRLPAVSYELCKLLPDAVGLVISFPVEAPDYQHGQPYDAIVSIWLSSLDAYDRSRVADVAIRALLADIVTLDRCGSLLVEERCFREFEGHDHPAHPSPILGA